MAQVVVDMPDASAAGGGHAAPHRRAGVIKTDCRKPALGHEFVAPGNLGPETLDDQRAFLAVDAEAQPEDARLTRLECLLFEQAAGRLASTEQFFQQPA